MKKLLAILTTVFALAFLSAAQTSGGSSDSQTGSTGSQSSGSQTSGSQSSGSQTSSSSSQSTSDQGSSTEHSHHKGGGSTISGCLSGTQGAYTLKHGSKEVPVTSSEDLSAHIGHEVKLHGSWEKGGASSAGSTSGSDTSAASANSGTSSGGGKAKGDKTFNATSVEMVSESCGGKKGSDNSGSQNPK